MVRPTICFSGSPSSMLISLGLAVKDSSVGGVPLMEPARGGGELAKSLNIRLLSISNSIWKNPAICSRMTISLFKHGDTLDR